MITPQAHSKGIAPRLDAGSSRRHPQQSQKSLLVKWLSLLLEVVHEEFGFADKVIMKCTDFQVEDRLEGSSALDSVRRTAR